MKKALLPLLIASVMPVAAFADVTVYGKANLSWENQDKTSLAGTSVSDTQLTNNASRVGVKGSETISDGLTAIYQFEYGTCPDNGTCGTQTFSQRNIFVGLKGSGGTIIAGEFDTPLKNAQEAVDLFNDMQGDLATVLQGDTRATNEVQYSTPKFNDFTATVAYINSETGAANTKTGYSASFAYDTKPVYLAIANDHNVSNAMNQTVTTNDTDILRVVGRVNFGPVQLGAIAESYDKGTGSKKNGYLLSAQYKVNASWALKVQNVSSDMKFMGGQSTSFGADYILSKSTKVFGYYTEVKYDAVTPAPFEKDKFLGVGIELKF